MNSMTNNDNTNRPEISVWFFFSFSHWHHRYIHGKFHAINRLTGQFWVNWWYEYESIGNKWRKPIFSIFNVGEVWGIPYSIINSQISHFIIMKLQNVSQWVYTGLLLKVEATITFAARSIATALCARHFYIKLFTRAQFTQKQLWFLLKCYFTTRLLLEKFSTWKKLAW